MSGPPPTGAPAGGDGADLTRLAGLKLGNYRLEKLVGRGRMGAVYLAKDEALLRPTAVKILSWRAGDAQGLDPVQWFLAEARLVARINDPRVVQIYGAARQGEHCYIAMEYVAGRSAAAAVQDGPLTPEAATDVLVQAAGALSAAHRSGVVHRDVKPANLLMGTNGVTKLGDFGMALGVADLRTGTAHLRVGTPYYTAPEIWRGEAAGPASDIYSLGATYYQLLTGSPPFPGNDVALVEQGHLREPVPDPRERVPGIPPACAALARKALAKSPRDRHASAQELAAEGRRVLQELAGGGAREPRPAPRTGRADARAEGAPRATVSRAAREAPAVPAAQLPGWAQALGFVRTPFAGVDPTALPYLGEPFSSVSAALRRAAEDPGAAVVALAGEPGSGRTTLCRRAVADLAQTRTAIWLDLADDPGAELLLRRLARALGPGEPSLVLDAVEPVVERLDQERRRAGLRPVVIVDGLGARPAPLLELLRAAVAGRSFLAVVVGEPGAAGALSQSGLAGEGISELPVPALTREQVAAYVRGWVEATLGRRAPPLLFSPDALLLLGLRTGGNLARIDRVAENMLVLAAARGRRTLTSFEAWTAPVRERWGPLPAVALPRRPACWPTPLVLDAINECRRAAGIRPWPRGADERLDPERPAAGERKR